MYLQVIEKAKEHKKTILILSVVIVALYLLKSYITKLYNYIKNSALASGSTMTNESANAIVQRLLNAFDNLIPYSSFETVKDEFYSIPLADYYLVKRQFGKVYRNELTGAPVTGTIEASLVGREMDLNEWLNAELSSEQIMELKGINSIFVNIL